MWQRAGASALQHSAEWSSELLAVLSDYKAEPLTGKGTANRPSRKHASEK